MLFALDIGNTQTVMGVYDESGNGELLASWRIATNKSFAKDDVTAKLIPLFDASSLDKECINAAVVASVVPFLTTSWRLAIKDLFGVDALLCTSDLGQESGLFDADYPNPSEIGPDRVADAIAVKAMYGYPSIIVDFGTATNMEIIDANGRFVGGVIAPGLQTGANALLEKASGLASMDMSLPDSVVGKSTIEALQSGIILGEAARVDGLIDRIVGEHDVCTPDMPCKVIATGGLASSVASCSKYISAVEPNLTLYGLFLLAKTVHQKDKEQ